MFSDISPMGNFLMSFFSFMMSISSRMSADLSSTSRIQKSLVYDVSTMFTTLSFIP